LNYVEIDQSNETNNDTYCSDLNYCDVSENELKIILENVNGLVLNPNSNEIPEDLAHRDEAISNFTDNNLFDELIYDEKREIGKKKIDNLVINLGSTDIFRISCANHKINLAIRTAITNHQAISDIFKKMNSFCDKMRSTIAKNNVFKEFKCRMRIENNTRWGSAFIILEVYKKAFERGIFENIEDCTLPFHISVIDLILLILKPIYIMSINFQSMRSTIGDVIPVISITLIF
jgi:hypothetical protein